MATLARHQFFVTDDEGNKLAGASVQVNNESGGALASLYSDRAGASAIGNPFNADSDGFAGFYVIGGAYKITVTSGAYSAEFRYVGIGTAAEHDITDSASIGGTPASTQIAVFGSASAIQGDANFLWTGSSVQMGEVASAPADVAGMGQFWWLNESPNTPMATDDTGVDHRLLLSAREGQGPVTGGAGVTPKDLGTISSGTVTPSPGDRYHQKYTNNGAHTLAPHGSIYGDYRVDITNGASAGGITVSGWTVVEGDGDLTTTNGHKFAGFASVTAVGSYIRFVPLQ